MILNNAPQDKAILSNVGQIGEFRIRNSAKAFNILSSGLYANKIRAIIRELSCNAVDSHIAAGNIDTPFDVHLPNALEPWFSIRDYGTGLDHAQVTNIYTTYFESTKTGSNDFIGALGLGSKSPFSYTDNFTVTAVRYGHKGIYTAFINEHGVPSIALMHEEPSAEPSGVEVKFSVNDRYDFDKFRNEAQIVFVYFKLRPVIHGLKEFKFQDPTYKDKDIIKGVHYTGYNNRSIAVMGNIAYPIDVPQADNTLGNLRSLIECGLVMEFDIGELDFQASREGLSYIPSTVQAIKRKLEALNNQLAIHVASEADQLTNLWDRADYLEKRNNDTLWKNAVIKYITDTKFVLADPSNRYNLLKPFSFKVEELQKKYNINIRAFQKESHNDKCINVKAESIWDDVTKVHISAFKILPSKRTHFVITDTKRGAFERAKYHWRKEQTSPSETVYIIEGASKNQPVLVDKFLKDLYNPPRVINASQLIEKERAGNGNWGKASILKLEERDRSRRITTLAWAKAGSGNDYGTTETYYYVELNGWNAVGLPVSNIKDYHEMITRSGIFNDDVYGVRKTDIPHIRTQKNWVELTGHIRQKLSNVTAGNVMGLVKQAIDFKSAFKYSSDKINKDSPYYKLYAEFKDIEVDDAHKRSYLEKLLHLYGIKVNNVDPSSLIVSYREKVMITMDRYPMLRYLSYHADKNDVANYINMVDQVKGI